MEMEFHSFDIQEFMTAIENKDYIFIKTCIVSTIRNNPRFAPKWEETETYRAIKILEDNTEKLPDLWQTYQCFEEEPPYNESYAKEWSYEFFIRKSSYLKNNFCRKRINQLCKIGRSLAKQGKLPNFQEPQEPENSRVQQQKNVSRQANHHKQEQGKMPQFSPAIAMGIIALVVIVIILAMWIIN